MNHHAIVGVCVLLLVGACASGAPEDATAEASAPPVVLHQLDAAPGCWVPYNNSVGGSSMAEHTVQLDMAVAVQTAQFLLQPVLDDPTALEWLHETGGARIEGRTLARGDEWGELILVVISDESSVMGDVHYDPHATVLDYSNNRIVQSENYLATRWSAVGCDPNTGWSFHVFRGEATCWDMLGNPLAPPVANTQEELEMTGSATLMCMHMVTRMLQGYYPQE